MVYPINTCLHELAKPLEVTESLCTSFLRYLEVSPKSIETYERALRPFFRFLQTRGMVHPQRSDVVAYREVLKQTHQPATVQSYLTALKLFFQWLEQCGFYPNIAEHIKGPKLLRWHKKGYLTSDQAKAVLACVSGGSFREKRDYAILALLFTGGLRTIEISRANRGDLRIAGDALVLWVQGKGRIEKSDAVKVPIPVERAIRAYLAARGECDAFEPLFATISNNHKGGRMTTRAISGLVKTAFRKAGLDRSDLTAHSTRHTAVTLALLGGQRLEAVQRFARHEKLETTLVYAHHLEQMHSQCEATIAKAIF